MFTIHLAKETFKFSCSHFTILGPQTAERLHGHNYHVRVDIGLHEIDAELGYALDFNAVKPLVRKICDGLDERILLPTLSPYLQLTQSADQVTVTFTHKHYAFPSSDTLCLPITNITSEELARYACLKLKADMHHLPRWTTLRWHVEETRGQSVSYALKR